MRQRQTLRLRTPTPKYRLDELEVSPRVREWLDLVGRAAGTILKVYSPHIGFRDFELQGCASA
jgi:hypothetical protein